ncbi:MAG: MgtC/SapB family protein [Acidobacteriota bacterium]
MGIAVAALGGAAVGVERQRAYRENEPGAIGGLRTFAILGTLAGTCGFLVSKQAVVPAAVLLAGAVGIVLIVRLAAGKLARDATTEMAALAVLASGIAAGLGHLGVAAALFAWTVLLLIEKAWLHSLVPRLGVVEMEAAAQFAAMALIVFPLLPTRSFGPGAVLNLRVIWILVLVFSGISFAGYLARKALGSATGWVVTGMIGGLISSTQVAFSFARESQIRPESHRPLFGGTMAATVVSMLRVCAVCLFLRPSVAAATLACVALPVLIGTGFALHSRRHSLHEKASLEERTPLRVPAAIYLALIFIAAQFAAVYARTWFGRTGLMGSSALLGSFDIDALVASVVPMLRQGMPTTEAAQALALGIAGNTAIKCAASLVWGRGRFRRYAMLGFACMLSGLAASIFFLTYL